MKSLILLFQKSVLMSESVDFSLSHIYPIIVLVLLPYFWMWVLLHTKSISLYSLQLRSELISLFFQIIPLLLKMDDLIKCFSLDLCNNLNRIFTLQKKPLIFTPGLVIHLNIIFTSIWLWFLQFRRSFSLWSYDSRLRLCWCFLKIHFTFCSLQIIVLICVSCIVMSRFCMCALKIT